MSKNAETTELKKLQYLGRTYLQACEFLNLSSNIYCIDKDVKYKTSNYNLKIFTRQVTKNNFCKNLGQFFN